MRIIFVSVIWLWMALQLTSCQRSSFFRKDSNSGRGDRDSGQSQDSRFAENDGMGGKSLANHAEALGQPRKRVMVLNFWNDTPVKQNDFGIFASDELKRGLFLSQKVLLTSDFKNDLKTEDFVDGEHVRVAQLIREGRKLGVSILIIGRVTKIIFRQRGDDVGLFRQRQSLAAADVEIKVFDVQAGRELVAISQSGEASASAMAAFGGSDLESSTYRAELIQVALREAISKFVADVIHAVDKVAWQGRIAKLIGPKIYINAGKVSGLIAGDILRVMNPGEEVYDPQSGALLGKSQGQLKGTLEVVDFIGTDGAVTETHTGGSFREGDLVELY